jgi:hypothetical protein
VRRTEHPLETEGNQLTQSPRKPVRLSPPRLPALLRPPPQPTALR